MNVRVADMLGAVSTQFEVPEVMPKVWLLNDPLVVEANTWMKPGFDPKTIDPRPQPAVPYLA
jgi:hypothetical protein